MNLRLCTSAPRHLTSHYNSSPHTNLRLCTTIVGVCAAAQLPQPPPASSPLDTPAARIQQLPHTSTYGCAHLLPAPAGVCAAAQLRPAAGGGARLHRRKRGPGAGLTGQGLLTPKLPSNRPVPKARACQGCIAWVVGTHVAGRDVGGGNAGRGGREGGPRGGRAAGSRSTGHSRWGLSMGL